MARATATCHNHAGYGAPWTLTSIYNRSMRARNRSASTLLRIGGVARRAGVVLGTARHYERQGVFRAVRTSTTGALYDVDAITRLRFAVLLHRQGLSMSTIAAALAAWDAVSDDGPAFAALVDELDQRIAKLVALRGLLVCADPRARDLDDVVQALQATPG